MATPPKMAVFGWSTMELTREIDWRGTFSWWTDHRNPHDVVASIRSDVSKLRSCSEAGRRAIIEDRCARVGVSPKGVPTFYIGRTKAV